MSDILDLAVLGAGAYLVFRVIKANEEEEVVSPPDDNGWALINGEYRMSAISDISVYREGIEPQLDTLYWVYNVETDEYDLAVWGTVFKTDGSSLTGWTKCVAGKPIVIDVVGDKGAAGVQGPAGIAVDRGTDILIPILNVSSTTTTAVVGSSAPVTQGASQNLTLDLLVTMTASAPTSTLVLELFTGTTKLSTIALTFLVSSGIIGEVQMDRVLVSVPLSGSQRDLTLKLTAKQATASLEGFAY